MARSFLVIGIVAMCCNVSQASIFSNSWRTDFTVNSWGDATTNGNLVDGLGWTISAGADDYFSECYERPTAQDFVDNSSLGQLHFTKYHEALDIQSGDFALDKANKVAYFSINMVGQNVLTLSSNDFVGFKHFYRIRVGDNADFAGGYLFGVKDPYGNDVDGSFDGSNPSKSTQSWFDDINDGFVSGTGIGVTNEGTLGYAEKTSEGDSDAIRSRIVGNSVELAINYSQLGITDESVFDHIMFEANQGLTDVQNYFWNDEYSFDEAGDAYDYDNPVQNVYELDTLKGGPEPFGDANPVPEPATVAIWLIIGVGGAGYGLRRRLKKSH